MCMRARRYRVTRRRDDDMYCRPKQLTEHLAAQPDSGKTMRAGGFSRGAGVPRG
jgi:hypothetical protein